jgi:phosphomannomutase
VTRSGEVIFPDRQLGLFAEDVLSRNPGASIVFDVKCSANLARTISNAGGVPHMDKTGHSLIKAKMKALKSPLAGEMSGHIFWGERWYSFDDGTYTAARLLEIASRAQNPSALLEALPNSLATPEINLACAEGENHQIAAAMQALGAEHFPSVQETSRIDGLRLEYEGGFSLIRASNTTPVLVVRFEAASLQSLVTQVDELCGGLAKVAGAKGAEFIAPIKKDPLVARAMQADLKTGTYS